MDFVRTGVLDSALQRYVAQSGVPAGFPVTKLSLLGSSTLQHLHAGIRIGALRRGVFVTIHQGEYGMYQQEILNTASALHHIRPDVVCLSLDAHHVAQGNDASAERALDQMLMLWRSLKKSIGCTIIQQTVLPIFWPLMGNQEDRMPEAPASIVQRLNEGIRKHAASEGVYLLATDSQAAVSGISHWYDETLWFRSKQEVHPRASVAYGDQLGRVLGALKGLSAKCLVLDLDNTLWGGVIGDDGLNGIVLGQGSTVGEAHLALQRYCLLLAQRGVILAVCSKNDEKNAIAPFDEHPEMILRRKDIACFVANWQDKATNLRRIARTLKIGLDSLVFVDDNPAERDLVRRELPMVQVPELSDDPAEFVSLLASAGYFEAVEITQEDRQRRDAYRGNADRENLRDTTSDLEGYLKALQMKLTWQPFTPVALQRIVQLNNKTNQFNLTTQRYSEAEVLARMSDPRYMTVQLRLTDAYGDNGIIGLVVGRDDGLGKLEIETWLMSCRVLGRKVEEATLNIIAAEAKHIGCHTLIGTYKPTGRNAMVGNLYSQLGFSPLCESEDGTTRWSLSLEAYHPSTLAIEILEGETCKTHTFIEA